MKRCRWTEIMFIGWIFPNSFLIRQPLLLQFWRTTCGVGDGVVQWCRSHCIAMPLFLKQSPLASVSAHCFPYYPQDQLSSLSPVFFAVSLDKRSPHRNSLLHLAVHLCTHLFRSVFHQIPWPSAFFFLPSLYLGNLYPGLWIIFMTAFTLNCKLLDWNDRFFHARWLLSEGGSIENGKLICFDK